MRFTYKRKSAVLSQCGTYRYDLERCWEGGNSSEPTKLCVFVMLNPSTADADVDDPTIKKCVAFAERWGFNRLVVVNLFALRATDPRQLYKAADPLGPLNDDQLYGWCSRAGRVVCAWGEHGAFRERGSAVASVLREMSLPVYVLETNASGQPKHPLYIKYETAPRLWW